jgi:hypothetical protein
MEFDQIEFRGSKFLFERRARHPPRMGTSRPHPKMETGMYGVRVQSALAPGKIRLTLRLPGGPESWRFLPLNQRL